MIVRRIAVILFLPMMFLSGSAMPRMSGLGRREQGSGDTTAQQLLGELPAPADDEAWDREFQERLFAWAAQQVRASVEEKTWQAFWLTVMEGRSPSLVAPDLGLSAGAVRQAKARVQRRL